MNIEIKKGHQLTQPTWQPAYINHHTSSPDQASTTNLSKVTLCHTDIIFNRIFTSQDEDEDGSS